MKSKNILVTITGYTPTFRVELIREKSKKVIIEFENRYGLVGDKIADKILTNFNESAKLPAIQAFIVHQATGSVVAESGNPTLFKPIKAKIKVAPKVAPKKKRAKKKEKALTPKQKKDLISQQKRMRRDSIRLARRKLQ